MSFYWSNTELVNLFVVGLWVINVLDILYAAHVIIKVVRIGSVRYYDDLLMFFSCFSLRWTSSWSSLVINRILLFVMLVLSFVLENCCQLICCTPRWCSDVVLCTYTWQDQIKISHKSSLKWYYAFSLVMFRLVCGMFKNGIWGCTVQSGVCLVQCCLSLYLWPFSTEEESFTYSKCYLTSVYLENRERCHATAK